MESVISEIVNYTIRKIDKYIVTPVASEATYVCFINSNFKKLEREVEILRETRECVQNMVSNARRNAEDIKLDVVKWLSEFDLIFGKYEQIIVDERRHGRSCSNLVYRHKLSKQASKMVYEVIQLKEKGSFDQVSLPGLLINQGSLPKNVDFLDFKSRVLTMNQIMDALEENHVNKIGVYGMGGVGKTMFVKEIIKKIREKKSFDEVIISTISNTPDLKMIQGQLADMLSLKFEQETIEGRALKLRKRLMNAKRILVVLDDVWEDINLETIGIPSVEDHIGCKILFTSRERDLLSNQLCTNKTFEIKVLEKYESWNLFETTIGEIVEDNKPIADQIVKECAHLPIAITTVAKALRNKSFLIWEDALDQLRKPVAKNIKGMGKKVYTSLKLSYDFLECEEVKLLFLLCSMFLEDFLISIEDLQVYAMAMGFLNGVDTMAQGRCRIAKLVGDLISSSLLLQEVSKDKYVKMHDLIREVAILISSKSVQINTLSYVKGQNKEWEEDKLLANYTAVYINICASHGPLQKLLIPKVQLLTLCGTLYNKYELEESFFEEMEELKSLEVQAATIPLFSLSLRSFANIRLLRLLDCQLGNIDMIGELRKLEILSFKGSNITQIPINISQLTQLKVLDLSLCEVKVIPPHVLSRLTKLEELYLGSFDGWESDELYEGKKNANLSELKYLLDLYALNLRIQDEKVIPKQLFPRELNFKKFNISIGSMIERPSMSETSKSMYLNIESSCCLDDWIKTLLKRSEQLHLIGSIGTKILKFELDKNAVSHLKYLRLDDNLEFQHFIHEGNNPLRIMLSNLVDLQVKNLENLESIINGYDRESPFKKLSVVIVHNCNKLKTLFLNCIVDDILPLEEIIVSGCKKLEVMFVMENEEAANHIEFTRLKNLSLYEVPRLQYFCSKSEKHGQLRCDDSEKAEANTINNVYPFFNEQVSLPNLEKLIITRADNLKMIWHNIIFIPHSFSKLKKVLIWNCNSLQKIFPLNIMSMLSCLNIIDIRDCNSLQEIFEVKESTDTEVRAILIPKLRNLRLSNLPNLEYIWSNDPSELTIFEDMKNLEILKCPKLKRKYSAKVLKQQECVKVDFDALLEAIENEKSTHRLQPMQDGLEWFSNLRFLTLIGSLDHKLTQLPMEVVQILHNLEEYEVTRIFVEEIFPNNVDEYLNATSMRLERLHLFELPKLRHIWKPSSGHKNISLLEDLESLIITRCSRLNTLLPSSMSFRSLVRFYVDECHGLTNLMNPAAARVLVQLKYLSLRNCKRMITVIATEGDEEGKDEIVFNKLLNLDLSHLSTLTNFCSEKCIIRFPLLSHVTIEDCSEMKAFSMGMVATPSLSTKSINFINLNSEEIIIVSDINVICRQFWEDNSNVVNIKNLFAEEEILEENHSDSP